MILSRFRRLERLDWRPAAVAVAVGLLVRFGLIGAIDQVLYAADVADNISVRQAYAITLVTFWGTTITSMSAGWLVYHTLRKRWGRKVSNPPGGGPSLATAEVANG